MTEGRKASQVKIGRGSKYKMCLVGDEKKVEKVRRLTHVAQGLY